MLVQNRRPAVYICRVVNFQAVSGSFLKVSGNLESFRTAKFPESFLTTLEIQKE